MKPLGPMDQAFLWLERRNQAMHVGSCLQSRSYLTPPPTSRPAASIVARTTRKLLDNGRAFA
jgi:hypothetical protein